MRTLRFVGRFTVSRARGPALLALLLAGGGCSHDDSTGADPTGDDRLRARAESFALEQQWTLAAKEIAPLAERPNATLDDLVRAALIELQLAHADTAQRFTDRAFALAPADPAASNLRGHLFKQALDFEQAADCFRQVLATDGGDLAARFELGETLENLGDFDGARQQYEAVRSAGVFADKPLFKMATFKIWRMLLSQRQDQAALVFKAEYDALQGIDPLTDTEVLARGLGRVRPPAPHGVPPGPPAAPGAPAFTAGAALDLHGAEHLLVADLDADGRNDICGWGPHGLAVALQKSPGRYDVQQVHERAVLDAAAGDLDPSDPEGKLGPPSLEIVTIEPADPDHGGGFAIYGASAAGGPWQRLGPDALQAGGARAVILSDFDHEGDLDIVLAGDSGLRFQRNDGALRGPEARFPDATPDSARALGPCRAVLAEDLDADNDVDFIVVTARGLSALSNLRGGRFADQTREWNLPQPNPPAATEPAQAVAALDLDEDGWADLVFPSVGALQWTRNDHGRLTAPAPLDTDGGALAPYHFADLDLDGHVDLLGARAAEVLARPGPLSGRSTPAALAALVAAAGGAAAPPVHDLAAADMDGDHDLDLVVLAADGARVFANDGPLRGGGLTVALHGVKANPQGIGSIVELRAGALYRRIYWRGPTVLGLGAQAAADVLRVTWPDGIVGAVRDKPAGQVADVVQPKGQPGSCPFLYTWNGSTFTFISDVLGTTPLGLPYAPDQYVPFNHEEFVKVRGDQLVPRDGRLELALTEELREVTYLDGATLHAIDHPAGTEIEPNERFTFPPFPEHHVHTLSRLISPPRVTASNGQDVTSLLASVDDHYAQAFERAPPQYKGLAEPWWLEITLAETPEQRAALAAAPAIRLVATGWFQWSDASVNMAAARHSHWRFEPPVLQVPDGSGGWKDAGPPLGFPAGKTKTMVIDITALVNRADPRLRLATTLQLSWDALRFALDADDAPTRDTALPPTTASLAFRGFSAPTTEPGGQLPERFDWNHLALEPTWNQHPGRYTRYGNVLPLLDAPDDMYVILGAGDCATLAFDATALPALPEGWTRDYLLHLDGWAKDRDPNTNSAERVDPLPFHAMSAYPPPPPEHFPDDTAHQRWQQDWNTREGAVLITPLTPDGP